MDANRQMDSRLRCARANWRPPILHSSLSHQERNTTGGSWLSANSRRCFSPHLFLLQCLTFLLIGPLLMSLAGNGADRVNLAPASQVEKSNSEGYQSQAATESPKRRTRLEEESSPPTTRKRTNNFPPDPLGTGEETENEEEQLLPILFGPSADSQEEPLTSSSNVTVHRMSGKRYKRSQTRKPAVATNARHKRKVIHALLRGQTQLACNLDSSEPDDSVSLVLWYKDSSTVPIFSLDARSSQTVQEARHKPGPLLEGRSSLKLLWLDQDPLGSGTSGPKTSNLHVADEQQGSRSRQHTSERHRKRRSRHQEPEVENDEHDSASRAMSSALVANKVVAAAARQLWAQLQIDSLSSEDNGVYVCRVDFRRARSRVQELALRIIVPADTPIIRDLSQVAPAPNKSPSPVQGRVIGPHNEGSRIVLECETQNGYPEPTLSWWRDGRLVDDSYEIVSGLDGLVINQVRPTTVVDLNEQPAEGQPPDEDEEEEDGEAASVSSSTDSSGDTQVSSKTSASSPARLIRNRLELGPLTRNDLLANYSCKAPNTKLQSEPPSSFVMIDMNLRPVKVLIDNERLPVLADRPLEIVCRAFGSRPAALISWFRGPSSSSGDKLIPQHPLPSQQLSLHRHHNHQLQVGFSAGQIKIEESIGSESNITTSTLTIWPRPHDSGQIVTCRAENPYMSNGQTELAAFSGGSPGLNADKELNSLAPGPAWIEDSWKLEVHYLPHVQLQLGEKLQGQPIREGQDIYFECRVQAQPPVHEIRWWFNGKELESNLSQGVIVSNQSLVLQRVSRSQRGHYTCSAINSVGEIHSSSLYLRVQFAPVCRDYGAQSAAINSSSSSSLSKTTTGSSTETDLFRANSQQHFKTNYGAARMESVQVFCHVDADPADSIAYKWAFLPVQSTSGTQSSQADKSVKKQQQMVYLDPSTFAQSQELGPLVSVATYTPRSELDYGTLLCWAQNELGLQADPCIYQVVAAEPPDPVRNCRLLNASDSQLAVACESGYDGGVDQSFQMEVYDSRKRELVANISSSGQLHNEAVPIPPTNNSIEQDVEREQDDSPSSAALSLTTGAGHQPRQRHSSHHNNLHIQSSSRQQPTQAAGPMDGNRHRGQQHQETLFITEPNLRPSTHYLLSIYSQNSKGASKPVAFTATTANSSSPTESSIRARFFSSSSSSQSLSEGKGSHLLSDVLALSWNPFLLVCAISVALFVLFGSLTFAMMKYVDHQQEEATCNAAGKGSSPTEACELTTKQSACLSKSDEQTSGSSGGSSCASTTNISPFGGQTRRARIITLAAANNKNSSGLSPNRGKASNKPTNGQQREKVSLLDASPSYLKMKLLKQLGGDNKSHLKQSNSDNFLDQLEQNGELAIGGSPAQPALFSSSSLQRPSQVSGSLSRQQALLLSYVPAQQPRIEQLLISGKQYFHQTAPKVSHLQATGNPSIEQRSNQYAVGGLTESSLLMKAHHGSSYDASAALCPHQQLIDGQAGDRQLNYYSNHLQLTSRDHQGQHRSLAIEGSSEPAPALPLHLAHLRLVDDMSSAGAFDGLQQMGHIDSASDSTATNQTLPSLLSFSHTTTTTTTANTANGSPSSGIPLGTPTPTSHSTSNNNINSTGTVLSDLGQHQQYCCGTALAGAGGSNSTITSSLIEPSSVGQQQQQQLHEIEGGNVISVSDCLLGATSNPSSSSASAGSGQQQQHKPTNNQFDGTTDSGFQENNTQQYLTYSALGLTGNHQLVCTDLNQYSVYVDHDAAGLDLNNNLLSQQQIYLLQDQQQRDQLIKYPTRARVRVFNSSAVSEPNQTAACSDRNTSNYLRLIHPNQIQPAGRHEEDSQQKQLQTDV